MLRSRHGVRLLGPADLDAVLALLAADPVPNVFVEYRARLTRMEPRWMGGEMWGYEDGGELTAVCHAGANLVPACAGEAAAAAFARRAIRGAVNSSTIVGPRDAVETMWWFLRSHWDRPREERWDQPHLVATAPSSVPADPQVRRTTPAEVDVLYPACVAMYTEEVGADPEADGGRSLYRARVTQLVHKGWSFSRIEDGRVLFKAEVAAATPSACQIQGVYVDPEHRGTGLATAGMAAVVRACLAEIAPAVSLYVNEHNLPARRAYARVGFEQTDTFATLML